MDWTVQVGPCCIVGRTNGLFAAEGVLQHHALGPSQQLQLVACRGFLQHFGVIVKAYALGLDVARGGRCTLWRQLQVKMVAAVVLEHVGATSFEEKRDAVHAGLVRVRNPVGTIPRRQCRENGL